jgi:hypothetical protein
VGEGTSRFRWARDLHSQVTPPPKHGRLRATARAAAGRFKALAVRHSAGAHTAGRPMGTSDGRTLGGGPLRTVTAGLCFLLVGCGTTHPVTRGGKKTPRRAVRVSYSVLERPGRNGISVIPPSQVHATELTPSHPVWVTLPAAHGDGAARPVIASAREITHAAQLRIWVAQNTGGGICMLAFSPASVSDPKHDHSLLVFCGKDSMLGHGQFIVTRWPRQRYFLVGVVPDGVRAVTVGLGNDANRVVPVRDNSYHAILPVRPIGVTFPGQT